MLSIVTLFDHHYAARGLVMLESLARHCSAPLDAAVLCMTPEAHRIVSALGARGVRALAVEELGDGELLALRGVRPHREFCWTATPALLRHALRRAAPGDTIAYLDADLMFFADPMQLLRELDGHDILIHEHRYAPDRLAWQRTSGIFNVGLVAFRPGEQAAACLERWRRQCLEKCELDPEHGYCGDQGYLDEWPDRYDRLRILGHLGGGVAPWNVGQYAVTRGAAGPLVNGAPVVFYHYHALRVVHVDWPFGLVADPAEGYQFPRAVQSLLYRPYLRALRRQQRAIRKAVGARPRIETAQGARMIIKGLATRALLAAL
jgi:hypothetical protein